MGRTGEAQEALERAEARLLDRSTDPSAASTPSTSPRIQKVSDARAALGHGDSATAKQIVAQLLAFPSARGQGRASVMPAANGASGMGAAVSAGGSAPVPSQGMTVYGNHERALGDGDTMTFKNTSDDSFAIHSPKGQSDANDLGVGNDTGN